MKAYKAFNGDWTCNGFQFEVGKTYRFEGELKICESGFHVCKDLKDCFNYYPLVQWTKFAEVEVIGDEFLEHESDSKICCREIKIVKELSFEEVSGHLKPLGVSWSDGVNGSYGVNVSYGVSGSCGVSWSDGVSWSYGVIGSHGVNESNGVNESDGVSWSYGVNRSYGVIESSGVSGSYGVSWSDGVSWSYGVNRSYGVNVSYGVNRSYGLSHSCFVSSISNHYLFNKLTSKERALEVIETLKGKLGSWKPEFTNMKELYLKAGAEWKKTPINLTKEVRKEKAWESMPKEAIEYLKSLPEFDAKVFKEVTGIEV